ncbi:hypothetical protein [Streptomyces sp. NPDC058247]|uniref:hypothetical protein n=1 Tax=Streptomyces sp. NPDC058247 TaxID=3346401 RepID=UPI0036E3D533
MSKILRKLAVTAVATMALGGTTLAASGTASADTSYHCRTSSHSVDNPAYSGALPDNFDFTVKLCAKRSGGYISSYAKISWDGPYAQQTYNENTFDTVRFHLQTKKSVSGPDKVVQYGNYTGLWYALDHASEYGNGSYETGTLKHKAGSSRYLADGYIQIDWNNDGRGYRNTYFSASPTV